MQTQSASRSNSRAALWNCRHYNRMVPSVGIQAAVERRQFVGRVRRRASFHHSQEIANANLRTGAGSPLKGPHASRSPNRRKKDKQRVIGPQDPNHTSGRPAASGANAPPIPTTVPKNLRGTCPMVWKAGCGPALVRAVARHKIPVACPKRMNKRTSLTGTVKRADQHRKRLRPNRGPRRIKWPGAAASDAATSPRIYDGEW